MLHILLPQHLMVISLEFVFCSKKRKCAGSLFADVHCAELEFFSIPQRCKFLALFYSLQIPGWVTSIALLMYMWSRGENLCFTPVMMR